MHLKVFLLLLGGVCISNVQCMQGQNEFYFDQQMSGSSNKEQRAQPEINTGFLEDINFDDFFEDIGVKGSHSTQHQTKVHAPKEKAEDDYAGFMSDDPLDEFLSSAASEIYEVPYEDSFFASSSDHFITRDSPYTSSSSNHGDTFGPPKDFFNDAYNFFGSESHAPKADDRGAAQESRQDENYHKEPSNKEKKSTEKCVEKQKNGMTCKVCKDDYGGFSEHCSHSLHGGKDQKYANSRRKSHDGPFVPEKEDTKGYEQEEKKTKERAESIATPKKTPSYLAHEDDGGYARARESFPDFSFPNTFGKVPVKNSKPPKYNNHQNAPRAHANYQQTHHQPAYQPVQQTHQQPATYQQPQRVHAQPPVVQQPQQYQPVYQQPIVHQQQPTYQQRQVQQQNHQAQPQYQATHFAHQNHQPVHRAQQTYQPVQKQHQVHQQVQNVQQPVYQPVQNVHPNYQPVQKVQPIYQAVHSTQPVYHVVPNTGAVAKVQGTSSQPVVKQQAFIQPPQYEVHVVQKPTNVQPTKQNVVQTQQKPQKPNVQAQPKKNDFGTDYVYDAFPSHPLHAHSSSTAEKKYKPMDPEKNFKSLGKLMKDFDKKDRKNCKKVDKKGMTCYQCKNKAGQVDEECIYEKNDPKDGVHMMYTEETSY